MTQSIWTDSENIETIGSEIGFLVLHERDGGSNPRWSLRKRPAHTNSSHEPRLHGWCGTTNNVSIRAEGLARISRVAGNGRVRLQRVAATPELLEELGYPELLSTEGR